MTFKNKLVKDLILIMVVTFKLLIKNLVSSMGKYSCMLEFISQRRQISPFLHGPDTSTLHWESCTMTASMLLDMMPLGSVMQKEPVFSVVLLFVMPEGLEHFLQCKSSSAFLYFHHGHEKLTFLGRKNSKREKDIFYYIEFC